MSLINPILSRRQIISLMLASPLLATAACSSPEPLLRVGSNGWPGYLFIEWAAERGMMPPESVRIVRMPSSSASMNALAAGSLEAACLTLDEVITLLAEGVRLRVVAVLDESFGADVLLTKPEISSLSGLRGKRIGVEQTAVGAVMLHAMLKKAGLKPGEIQTVPVMLDRQELAFRQGNVDALITMEPVASRLLDAGAELRFSSADIPGQIIDVLAVREDALTLQSRAIAMLVKAHFDALAIRHRPEVQNYLAGSMNLSAMQTDKVFAAMTLPDLAANRAWLEGKNSKLEQLAGNLASLMENGGLINHHPEIAGLARADWVKA